MSEECNPKSDNDRKWLTLSKVFSYYCDLQVKHLCGRRHHEKLKEWSVRLFPTTHPTTEQEIDLLDDSHYEEIEDE